MAGLTSAPPSRTNKVASQLSRSLSTSDGPKRFTRLGKDGLPGLHGLKFSGAGKFRSFTHHAEVDAFPLALPAIQSLRRLKQEWKAVP